LIKGNASDTLGCLCVQPSRGGALREAVGLNGGDDAGQWHNSSPLEVEGFT